MFCWPPFLFSAVGFLLILKFFRVVLLVHEVGRCHFPFWRFRWVYLSLNFLHKLKLWLQNIATDRRKPITFVTYFGCLVSNLRLFFRYFYYSVYYYRISFCHRSWLALFTSHLSSPSTSRFGASCASLYKRSHCTFASQYIFVGLNLSARVAQVSDCLRLTGNSNKSSHGYLKVLLLYLY